MLGWFIASIDWAVGFNRVRGQMNSLLTGWCSNSNYNLQPDTFVQASIADVSTFGLLIDDVVYISRLFSPSSLSVHDIKFLDSVKIFVMSPIPIFLCVNPDRYLDFYRCFCGQRTSTGC